MARFVSRYGNYTHGIREGREMVLADGQRQTLVTELIAVFEPAAHILNEDEIQQGLTGLTHLGLPIDRNTETFVSARSRLSGFDSVEAQKDKGWSDEERVLVEEALRTSQHIGVEFIELGAAPVTKPWPSYDETPATKIAETALTIGVPLDSVIAYEKANRNDATVRFLLDDAKENGTISETEEEAPVVIEA